MNRLTLAVLALAALGVTLPGNARAEERVSGRDGSSLGRVEQNGQAYARDGSSLGRVAPDGGLYGRDGSYQGSIGRDQDRDSCGTSCSDGPPAKP